MLLKNNTDHYGLVAIILHWIIAILIISLLSLGIYMSGLPLSLEKLKLYGWHKEYGFVVLSLVIIRLFWRFINTIPTLADLPWWEKLAAHSMHWVLYLSMLAMPLTGWFVTSAAGIHASFFGLFTLPNLIAPNEEVLKVFQFLHQWIGYGFIAAISVHTLAALKHHFIDKDAILRRMISTSRHRTRRPAA